MSKLRCHNSWHRHFAAAQPPDFSSCRPDNVQTSAGQWVTQSRTPARLGSATSKRRSTCLRLTALGPNHSHERWHMPSLRRAATQHNAQAVGIHLSSSSSLLPLYLLVPTARQARHFVLSAFVLLSTLPDTPLSASARLLQQALPIEEMVACAFPLHSALFLREKKTRGNFHQGRP